MKWLAAVYDWTLRENYRTWIGHAVLSLLLSVIFGPWAVMVFYLLRESEQIWTTWRAGLPQDWVDHAGDVVAAFLATGLYAVMTGSPAAVVHAALPLMGQ